MGLHKKLRVDDGKGFRLREHDPSSTPDADGKDEGRERLARSTERLREMQEMLFAQDRWSVLLIFQAMDAAGKDGTIEHVMSGVNPQGCQVYSLQGALARGAGPRLPVAHHRAPARARPHRHLQPLVLRGGAGGARAPRVPARQRLPASSVGERHLEAALRGHPRLRALPLAPGDGGAEVLPQRVEAGAEASASWPASTSRRSTGSSPPRDVEERAHWDEYMTAYEECIASTASEEAPWYVIPADHKWYMRMAVAEIVVARMEGLGLSYPDVDEKKKGEVNAARALLENEKS